MSAPRDSLDPSSTHDQTFNPTVSSASPLDTSSTQRPTLDPNTAFTGSTGSPYQDFLQSTVFNPTTRATFPLAQSSAQDPTLNSNTGSTGSPYPDPLQNMVLNPTTQSTNPLDQSSTQRPTLDPNTMSNHTSYLNFCQYMVLNRPILAAFLLAQSSAEDPTLNSNIGSTGSPYPGFLQSTVLNPAATSTNPSDPGINHGSGNIVNNDLPQGRHEPMEFVDWWEEDDNQVNGILPILMLTPGWLRLCEMKIDWKLCRLKMMRKWRESQPQMTKTGEIEIS